MLTSEEGKERRKDDDRKDNNDDACKCKTGGKSGRTE
jgi:hypothetical protein